MSKEETFEQWYDRTHSANEDTNPSVRVALKAVAEEAWRARDAEFDRLRSLDTRYWDRCAAGEDPASVAEDFPEMTRTQRNVTALANAIAKLANERDEARAAYESLSRGERRP